MQDTITLYSNQDLTTLVRTFEVEALSEPSDELTGRYQYVVSREKFREADALWDHDRSPLLTVRDELSDTDIFLGKPSAARVREALQQKKASVQLL